MFIREVRTVNEQSEENLHPELSGRKFYSVPIVFFPFQVFRQQQPKAKLLPTIQNPFKSHLNKDILS